MALQQKVTQVCFGGSITFGNCALFPYMGLCMRPLDHLQSWLELLLPKLFDGPHMSLAAPNPHLVHSDLTRLGLRRHVILHQRRKNGCI
jgi:hypothetical protein